MDTENQKKLRYLEFHLVLFFKILQIQGKVLIAKITVSSSFMDF